jgi:hypothetical protein
MPKGQAAPPRPYGERLAAVQAAVLAKVERGWTDAMIGADPGSPAPQTLYRWARADPDGFGLRLREARRWGKVLRHEGRAPSWAFHELKALAFLERVRSGEAVRNLVREAGQPYRRMLNSWKRQRPDFAADLAEAARVGRRARPGRWERFDPAEADRILLAVMRGATMPQALAGRGTPGQAAIRSWKRQQPDWAAALRKAQSAGYRRRHASAEAAGTGRGRCTPDLMARVEDHILHGGSLRSASLTLPGSPHYGTLYGWMARKPHFAAMVEQAREWRNEALRDEIEALAMEVTPANYDRTKREIGRLFKRLGQVNSGRPPDWAGTLE